MKSPRILSFVQISAFVISTLFYQSAYCDEIIPQLIQKLKSRTSVLDREMVTFRYEVQNNFEPSTLEDIRGRITGWPERFMDKTIVTLDMAGPGTYLAIDPFASRSFGGAKPQLYVLTLKKGIRILDLEDSASSDEKELFKKIQKNLQCKRKIGDTEALISEESVDLFELRRSSTEACREVAISIVKGLNIQALIYNYSGSNSLSECRDRNAAINVISTDALDFSKSLFYSNEHLLEATNQGPMIKNIYLESSKDFLLLLNSGLDEHWPAQLEKKNDAIPIDYLQWKKSRIFKCGEKWAFEQPMNLLTDTMNFNFKLNYKNLEIEALILNLKKAFTAKAPKNNYFNLSNLILPAKLDFMSAGFPQDDATFEHWLFLAKNSFNPTLNKEFMDMYAAKTPPASTPGNLVPTEDPLKSMTEEQKSSPDFFLKIMESYGVKGPLVIHQMNQINSFKGGIIISSMDPKKSFAENIAISRETYKKGLQDCISKYLDPNLSFEDIQKTICAVKN